MFVLEIPLATSLALVPHCVVLLCFTLFCKTCEQHYYNLLPTVDVTLIPVIAVTPVIAVITGILMIEVIPVIAVMPVVAVIPLVAVILVIAVIPVIAVIDCSGG